MSMMVNGGMVVLRRAAPLMMNAETATEAIGQRRLANGGGYGKQKEDVLTERDMRRP